MMQSTSPGIVLRVLGVVAFPLAGMLFFASSVISSRSDESTAAGRVRKDAEVWARLAATEALLRSEMSLTQALAFVPTGGGVEAKLRQHLGEVRRLSDAGVTELSASLRSDLTALRGRVDEPGSVDGAIYASYRPIRQEMKNLSVSAGAPLLRVDANQRTRTAVASMIGSVSVLDASLGEGEAMLATLADPNPANRMNLSRARGRYERTVELVRPQLVGNVASHFDQLGASASYEPLDKLLHDVAGGTVADGTSEGRTGTAVILSAVEFGAERNTLLLAAVQESATELVAAGREAERQALSSLRRTLALGLAIGAVVALLLCQLSRSIVRPLRRMEQYVRQLRSGDLSMSAADISGSGEVAAVRRALGDLVESLQSAERQVTALANGDFDAASSSDLPGEMGAALRRSVDNLSTMTQNQKAMRTQMEYEITHDGLTALVNRQAAVAALDAVFAENLDLAVVCLHIDLDNFKQTNDALGTTVGDALLAEVARRLSAAAPRSALVARIGGDEFAVIWREAVGSRSAGSEARRIMAEVSGTIEVLGCTTQIGTCVGLARSEGAAHRPANEVLREASIAVHEAKRAGRGQLVMFDLTLQERVDAETEIEVGLARAIANGELFLDYQPVVTMSGELRAVEALVRWNHPTRGVLVPADFIYVAEKSDLIVDLGRWVLQTATNQLSVWGSVEALRNISMSVNISGRHLAVDTLVDDVVQALGNSGLVSDRLLIEITETVILNDINCAAEQLCELRAMGVRIALDDFGTGYTSLTQLQQLPLDVIKIDRSLVSKLDSDREAHLVRILVDLGHALGLVVVAEGVETAAELEALRALGCDALQGFLIDRGLDPDVLERRWSVPARPQPVNA